LEQVLGTENGTGFGAMAGAARGDGTNVHGEYAWALSIGGKILLLLRICPAGGVLGLAGDGTLGMGLLPAFDPEFFSTVVTLLK
jgi:hypothetical protein